MDKSPLDLLPQQEDVDNPSTNPQQSAKHVVNDKALPLSHLADVASG